MMNIVVRSKNYDEAEQLKREGAKVSYEMLEYAIDSRSSTEFKLIWPLIGLEEILQQQDPLVFTYLQRCRYPVHEWLECFQLILTSPFEAELMEHARYFSASDGPKYVIINALLNALCRLKVCHEEMHKLIFKFISEGFLADGEAIEKALNSCACNDEIEALIYTGRIHPWCRIQHKPYLLTAFVLGIEFSKNPGTLIDYLHTYHLPKQIMLRSLGYFSMSHADKQRWINDSEMLCPLCRLNEQFILDKLENIPTFPSLFELCRSEVRKSLQNTERYDQPYLFYDAVKGLGLPPSIEDKLLFKSPLYRL